MISSSSSSTSTATGSALAMATSLVWSGASTAAADCYPSLDPSGLVIRAVKGFLPGARPARYFCIGYPDFSPRFTLP